jgi:hypothetical protein
MTENKRSQQDIDTKTSSIVREKKTREGAPHSKTDNIHSFWLRMNKGRKKGAQLTYFNPLKTKRICFI